MTRRLILALAGLALLGGCASTDKLMLGEAFYAEGASSWTVPWFDELPDRDAYVPFIYGQKYDDFRFFPKPKRFGE